MTGKEQHIPVAPDRVHNRSMVIRFRFPVVATGPGANEVELLVPTDPGGVAPLSSRFIEALRLNDNEVDKAEMAAMRAIAVIEG